MSSISQNQDNRNEIFDFTEKFIREFHIGKLLFKCNTGKATGIPVMDIFRYLLCLVFSDRSDYMQRRTGTSECTFSKNTMYRFLNNAKINWQRFIVLLSSGIILDFMKPLTDENRKDVFIVDDSLFDRSRSKKTELLANVFDHCSMKFRRGYRMLTLGWSDGNSFVPVDYCLLSAADDKNLLCGASPCDGRSLAGKRRSQSRRKATDVMIELVAAAQKAGITAKYILFDSWFSSPKAIITLKKERGLDTIAMVKKGKTKYLYQGKGWDIEVFFKSCKSYLRLVKECRSLSYDALTAHTAIVFTKYMMLSIAKRCDEDDRTICELFYVLLDEMEDITFSESMQIILVALMETVMEYFHITEAQLEEFSAIFVSRLPKYMQEAILGSRKAV